MGAFKKLGGDSSSDKSWKQLFWQQNFNGSTFPHWFYSHQCQVWCNLILGSILLAIGIMYLAIQQSILELAVPYDHSTQKYEFTLNVDWPGPVFVYYEVENFHANYKSFVESKDHFIVGSSFSKYNCDGAESREDVLKIRPSDEVFRSMIEGHLDIRPCGLAAFSFLLDRFELYRSVNGSDGDGREQRLLLDETDLALNGDREHFGRKIVTRDAAPPTIENEPSFLWAGTAVESRALLEHFMVWYRGASSSTFRNLWARINETLPAGTYSWVFQDQSAVWSKWGVKKKVVLTTMSTFGTKKAFLGATFIFAGVALLGVSLAFRSPPGGAQPETGARLRPDLKEVLQQIARQKHAAHSADRRLEQLQLTSVCSAEDASAPRKPGTAW